jgi:alpha-tubulin suppressor-like RCC1 family protein
VVLKVVKKRLAFLKNAFFRTRMTCHHLMLQSHMYVNTTKKLKEIYCSIGLRLTNNYDFYTLKIACGEDFSIAVSEDGFLFSAGSGEYGQLGDGETGECITQSGKTSFSTCTSFVRRSVFCHAPNEKLYTSGGNHKDKVVPIDGGTILIDKVACGRRHTVAVEKIPEYSDTDVSPRVFSWGCGSYGCLGHGVQVDEHYPREIGSLTSTIKMSINGAKAPNKKNPSFFSVSAGPSCSLLQLPSGHVYYWGKHRSIGEATMRPIIVDALANNGHVARHCDAGNQSVILSTSNAVTVAWGQGPYGELGLNAVKSSSKPTFIPTLDGCRVASVACGYGHTLFVVRNDDIEDKVAVKKLPLLNHDDCHVLIQAAAGKARKEKDKKKK